MDPKPGAERSPEVAASNNPDTDLAATVSHVQASIETSLPPTLPLGDAAAGASLPEQFGRYKIEKELGKGAMGVVYLAEDTQLGRKVALKIPKKSSLEDPEALERFYREARTAATLRHNNICPVYDVGAIDGAHYLTMAYIPGKPVSSFLGKGKLPAAKQVALLIRKIALALDEAHKHGIVHRDLKPSNVMLDDRGEPIVMDFGLARQTNSVENARLTQSGAILGTPAYMAPEQVRGELDQIGPQSDIYALGVMLYQFLTGQLPFTGPIMMVFAQILTEQPKKPSDLRSEVDSTLEAICLKMMAKDASQRYGSMKDVAAALTEYVKRGGVAGLQVTPISAPTVVIEENEPEASFKNLLEFPDAESAWRKSREKKPARPQRGGSWGLIQQQRWFRPAAGGLAAVSAIGLLAVTILLRNDMIEVEIKLDDPTAIVKVDGRQVQIDGAGIGKIRLTLKEHSYTVERNDEVIEGPVKFIVVKDGNQPLEISTRKRTEASPPDVEQLSAKGALSPAAGETDYALVSEPARGELRSLSVDSLHYDGSSPLTIEFWFKPDPARLIELVRQAPDLGPERTLSNTVAGFDASDGRSGTTLVGAMGAFNNVSIVHYVWLKNREAMPEFRWHFTGRQKTDGGPTLPAYAPGFASKSEEFQHVALVLTGPVNGRQQRRCWVDGRAAGESTAVFEYDPFAPFALGTFAGGAVDEIRVSKTARYRTGFVPERRFKPDGDTLALYHCDEGSGDQLIDVSGNGHHGKLKNVRWVSAQTAKPAGASVNYPARPGVRTVDALSAKTLNDEHLPVGEWMDVLSRVKLPEHVYRGKWRRTDGGLKCQPEDHARFMVPVAIRGGYELTCEFTRKQGNDAVIINLPTGSRRCALSLSAFDGKDHGINLVDGQYTLSFAPSSGSVFRPGRLENNKRYRLAVSIMPLQQSVSIKAKLDDLEIISWTGDASRLSISAYDFVQCPFALGIVASVCEVEFHSINLKLHPDAEGYFLNEDWKNPVTAASDVPSTAVADNCIVWNGRKYFLSEKPMTFPQAQQLAIDLKGRLLTISSPSEEEFFLKAGNGRGFWMAAWRNVSNGEWRDERDRLLRYVGKWHPGQPQATPPERHLTLWTNDARGWHDVSADNPAHACIEWGEEYEDGQSAFVADHQTLFETGMKFSISSMMDDASDYRPGWRIEDDNLRSMALGDKFFWFGKTNYTDFQLEAEYKIVQGRGAVFVARSEVHGDRPKGYGVGLGGAQEGLVVAGAICRFAYKSGDIKLLHAGDANRNPKLDEWATLEVTVRGKEITSKINGVVIGKFTDGNNEYPLGRIGFAVMPDAVLVLRKVRVKPL